jgi:hypothetical protein
MKVQPGALQEEGATELHNIPQPNRGGHRLCQASWTSLVKSCAAHSMKHERSLYEVDRGLLSTPCVLYVPCLELSADVERERTVNHFVNNSTTTALAYQGPIRPI